MKVGEKVIILKHDDYHTQRYIGKVGEITAFAGHGRFEVGFGKVDSEGWHEEWDLFDKEFLALSPERKQREVKE